MPHQRARHPYAHKRVPSQRKQRRTQPSATVWWLLVLVLAIFTLGIMYLAQHQPGRKHAALHQQLVNAQLAAQSPHFEFYTALPQGNLTPVDPNASANSSPAPVHPASAASTLATPTVATPPSPLNSRAPVTLSLTTPTPVPAPTPTTQTATAPVTTTPPPAPSTKQYYLQVGSFPNYSNADSLRAELLLQSFNANVSNTLVSGKKWYRVIVGPYPSAAALHTAQQALIDMHYSAIKLEWQP